MGIDFGLKRIGVALSDEKNKFALPRGVLLNDKNIVVVLQKIMDIEQITDVVIGESKNYAGKENQIMKKARIFAKKIETAGRVRIHWEPEFLTSAEAARIQGATETLDASAAALVLKSFLEKRKNSV